MRAHNKVTSAMADGAFCLHLWHSGPPPLSFFIMQCDAMGQ